MNNQAAELVEAILVSCDIYHNWKANLNKNLEDRTMLMKRSFMDYYNEALNQEELPRVFVKIEGAHTQGALPLMAIMSLEIWSLKWPQ